MTNTFALRRNEPASTPSHVVLDVFYGQEGQRAHSGQITMRRDEYLEQFTQNVGRFGQSGKVVLVCEVLEALALTVVRGG